MSNRRSIVVLAVPPIEELDLVGPVQVLSTANRLAGPWRRKPTRCSRCRSCSSGSPTTLGRDLSTARLADRVSMSVRNFGRVFGANIGTTPAKYVLHLRVEAARRLLQSSPNDLKRVARTVGFGSVDGMRRAFIRVLGRSCREVRDAAVNSKR